jgi:tetratricopeptide (TPR) repeat protein
LISRFRISTAIAWVTAALVLIGCLVVTEYQIRFWQNSIALFSHALAVTKDNAIAHINLGVALEEEPTDRRTDALREYQTAIQIDPNRLQAHNNLANLQASMGQRDEALKEYQEALRLNPNAAMAHANQATLLAEMGRFDDSMREFAEATRLTPGDPRPYYLMGKACLRHGQSAEAIKHFRESMQLQPNDFQTITWLARVLAADEDSAVRNGTEAVSLAARAVELTGGQEPFVLDTLAMAYAEAGRFKEAQDAEQNAIDLATAAKSQKTISEMQQRLQLYQAGKPSREDFKQVAAVTN